MSTRNAKVPPFIDEETERFIQKTRQSLKSYILMGFGWLGLTIAMLGGAKVVYDYLTLDPKPQEYSIVAPLIILALTYFSGWIVSLVSIRKMYNLIMPVVIQVYSFGVVAGILFVYFRGIYKIFYYQDDGKGTSLPSNSYFWVLLVGYLVLVSLSLLVQNFKLSPHIIILLITAFVHLVIGVNRYVFIGNTPDGLISFDIYFLATLLLIVFLLSQKWLYAPLKRSIIRVFRERRRSP